MPWQRGPVGLNKKNADFYVAKVWKELISDFLKILPSQVDVKKR